MHGTMSPSSTGSLTAGSLLQSTLLMDPQVNPKGMRTDTPHVRHGQLDSRFGRGSWSSAAPKPDEHLER